MRKGLGGDKAAGVRGHVHSVLPDPGAKTGGGGCVWGVGNKLRLAPSRNTQDRRAPKIDAAARSQEQEEDTLIPHGWRVASITQLSSDSRANSKGRRGTAKATVPGQRVALCAQPSGGGGG